MRPWSKEETIIAFNVYCKIPFKASSKNHPLVKYYANILGRSPSALNMKIGNIGRFDPDLANRGITGLTHGAKLEQEVWDEFNTQPDHLAYESERLIAKFKGQTIEESAWISAEELPEGIDRIAVVKQRVNQSFFRSAVLNAYNNTCCISGISHPSLVEACHIADWSSDIRNRTNPRNGLCLNPFFHKAYDKHFISISPDYDLVISDQLMGNVSNVAFRKYLSQMNRKKIILPTRFLPLRELLAIHYEQYLSL